MKNDLVATFKNELGYEHDWTYKGVNADLPADAIKDACQLLTSLDIFEQNGVKQFASVVTAKIVTTTETEIFDVKNDPSDEDKQLPKETKEIKTANPSLLMKHLEQSVATKENNSAIFPTITLPASQLAKIPAEPKNNLVTSSSDKMSRPQSQPAQRNGRGFKRTLARLLGKKGKNKDDPY